MRGIRIAALSTCFLSAVALSGCADSIYPQLPNIGALTDPVLSPEEQKQAIQDLSEEQKTHGAEAAEEIERRQ